MKTLPRKGARERFEASSDVRDAISQAYDLESVTAFLATAEITHWKARGFRISGQVDAVVVQPCAVSGEPLEVVVCEPVDATYVPTGSPLAKPRLDDAGELIFDAEGNDIPDEFDGTILDLADVWLEHFALGLDPFARIEGAEFAEVVGRGERANAISVCGIGSSETRLILLQGPHNVPSQVANAVSRCPKGGSTGQ